MSVDIERLLSAWLRDEETDEAFDDGLARVGAKALALALRDPGLFRKHGAKQ